MSNETSLRALKAERARFAEEMAPFLDGACNGSGENSVAVATGLLDLVIASFETRLPAMSPSTKFDKACVSAFGDAMVPLLRDILGSDVSISFLAHCIDGYWLGVRHVLQDAA